MRCLLRISLNTLTAASIILFLATLILSARSFTDAADLWKRDGPRSATLGFLRGRLLVETRSRTVVPFRRSRSGEQVDTTFVPTGWRHAAAALYGWESAAYTTRGFASDKDESRDLAYPDGDHIERTRLVAVPLWCPLTALALLPAIRLVLRCSRGRRSQIGLCPHCNYDLRATPDRCPECGKMSPTRQ